ncbi:hypothetical protein Tco_0505736 [Tanacetum coccineum]
MAGMNTRLNIKKLDKNIVQKHGGSKQVGFKQLAPCVETGVHRVSNDDTVVAQRWLEDKQSEDKTNTDCLVKEKKRNIRLGVARIQQQNGLVDETNVTLFAKLASIKQGMLKPVKVKCIFLRCREGIVGKKLWRLDEVTSKVVLYRKIGFNESGEYKKTFIGSGVDMGSMQVLHRFEFEVEQLGDHTFELARDREQHLACELFGYREYSNEATFAAAVVDKIYAHESLTFNDTFACKAISKWKAELKEDMDTKIWVTKGLLVKSKGNVLGLEIIRDQGGNTLRVSQSRIHNKKLVHTLLKGHSTLSLKDSLSGDCDVEKNNTWKPGVSGEAWKKKIWLKGLLKESGYELRLVAGIATGALVKGGSRLEVPAQVEVVVGFN